MIVPGVTYFALRELPAASLDLKGRPARPDSQAGRPAAMALTSARSFMAKHCAISIMSCDRSLSTKPDSIARTATLNEKLKNDAPFRHPLAWNKDEFYDKKVNRVK
jgi:hypothetical protein